MTTAPIVVLGAGPAGATVACGLARLGYDVTVVGGWRRFHALEGVSARVLDGLRHAGLAHAAACATGPYPRTTRWNGQTRTLNAEFLLDRRLFDAALREDLARAGVALVPATVRAVHSSTTEHRIVIETDAGARTLHADFLVEARGRQAPHGRDGGRGQSSQTACATDDMRGTRVGHDIHGASSAPHDTGIVRSPRGAHDAPEHGERDTYASPALLRGPQTLSLTCTWPGATGKTAAPGREVGGALESLPHGWSWMARLPDGRCYWQIALDAATVYLPRKSALPALCQQMRQTSAAPLARAFFGADAGAHARVFARSSTATLDLNVGGANWLRVGDAAMAVDPLSGNGIFQALSSALQAPAVIHTLRTHPERAALALRFHRQRIAHLFTRFARTGRDFYALEQQWPDAPFWRARRAWPDHEPLHLPPDFAALKTGKAPVIDGDLIAEAQVVVSPDQPLGVWHLQGTELAPIVDALRRRPADQVLATLPQERARPVRAWLAAQGYRFDSFAQG